MAQERSLRLKRPWEPIEGESAGAYTAFCLYRDFGIGRSLKDVERAMKEMPDSRVGYDTLIQWSSKFDWEDRILGWDTEMTRVRHEAETREMKRSAARIAQEKMQRINENLVIASQLKMRVLQMLDYPIERTISEKKTDVKGKDGRLVAQIVQKVIEPNKWGVRDAAILMRTAYDLEKLSLFQDETTQLDASEGTLTDAERRVDEFRQRQIMAIENIPLVPPGSLTNPLDGTPSQD